MRRTSCRIAMRALMWACGVAVGGETVGYVLWFRLASSTVCSTLSHRVVRSSAWARTGTAPCLQRSIWRIEHEDWLCIGAGTCECVIDGMWWHVAATFLLDHFSPQVSHSTHVKPYSDARTYFGMWSSSRWRDRRLCAVISVSFEHRMFDSMRKKNRQFAILAYVMLRLKSNQKNWYLVNRMMECNHSLHRNQVPCCRFFLV